MFNISSYSQGDGKQLWSVPSAAGQATALAIANGSLFASVVGVCASAFEAPPAVLIEALNSANGAVQWKHQFGSAVNSIAGTVAPA